MSSETEYRDFEGGTESDRQVEEPLVVKNSIGKKKLYFNQYIPLSINEVSLSEDALKLCGFMTYRFYSATNLKSWLPLSSDLLRTIVGGNYGKVIGELLHKNIWELFEHESGATYSARKHLCKTYRFRQPYRDEMYGKRVSKTRCSTQKVYYDRKPQDELVNVNAESAMAKCPHVDALLAMYKDLTLMDSWQTDLWGIEELIEAATDNRRKANLLADKAFAVQIGTGSISISTKHTGRLFHPAILMRRELRQYLRYKGEKVSTIDVKAAHPIFLGKFASDEDKRRWLIECNTGTIYDNFATDKSNRDKVKEAFQLAVSYSPDGKGKLAKAIAKHIEDEYPSIYAWLVSQWSNCEINDKHLHTPQFILQSLEAKIFIKSTFLPMSKKFWLIPMHDGFLVEKGNTKALIAHINKVALKELGFRLTITVK